MEKAKEVKMARVRLNGQDGYFLADIIRHNKLSIIKTHTPINHTEPKHKAEDCSHWVHDFPKCTYRDDRAGILIIPTTQVFVVNPL